MKYEILNKPYFKPAINATEVQIYSNAPYTVITRDLSGDVADKPDDELIRLVLDQVAIEYDPTDKLNQLDRALVTVDEKLKELDEITKESKKRLDEAIKESKEQTEVIQGAFVEVMDLVGKLMEQPSNDTEAQTN